MKAEISQRLINAVVFFGGVFVLFMHFYLFNLSASISKLLIGGIIILALSFAMLNSRKFLIFCTALFLMLTATQFGTIKNIMETFRWIPLIVFAFIFISNLLKNKNLPREIEWIDKIMFVIIITMFLSAFYSIAPVMTIKRAGTFLLLYVSVFWVIYPEIHSKKDAEEVIGLILFAAFIPYTISFVLLFFPPIAFYGDRFMGYFLNPNTIGILTSVLLPLILWKVLERKNRWARILLLFAFLSLVFSGSRSGLLGSVIGGGYYIFMTRKKWRIPSVFLGLLIIILMFIAGEKILDSTVSYMRLSSAPRTTEVVKKWNIIASGRIEKWMVMITLIKKRPFQGYGFGTEDLLFQYFRIPIETTGLYTHNSFLGMAAQIGILGLILFFFPISYLLFKLANPKEPLIYALKGMLIAGLIISFFESWVYSIGNAFAFPFWVGVILLLNLEKQVKRHESSN